MIPKGLNVGDTFEDGGFFYIVEELCDMGYVSRRLSEDNLPKEEKPEQEESVERTELPKEEKPEQEESVERTELPKEEKPESKRGRKPRKEQGQ